MSISVVIPAYNAERYLGETLESVLAQTMPADEILVVDDGSTDATAAVAERFSPLVKVFRRPNSKAAASRNFGVKEAKGEWIAFVDADDIWFPEKLQRQMEALRSSPEADLCYTAMVELLHEGDTTKAGKLMAAPPPAKLRQRLSRNCAFLPSSVVIRKSVLIQAGGFNETFRSGCEDYDLWFRLYNRGMQFAACAEPLVHYRRHGNNTALTMDWFLEYTEVYRKHNLPYLSAWGRWITWNRFYSESAYGAGLHLYQQRDPRALRMLSLAILRFPINKGGKYLALRKAFGCWMTGNLRNSSATSPALSGVINPTERTP